MKKVEVFQNLIDSIKTNSPGLISEQLEQQMTQQFDNAITDITTTANQQGYQLGKNDGFKAGYEQGKRIAGQKAKAELEKVINDCDQEAVQKVQNIIEMLDTNHAEKLDQVYQLLLQQKQQAEADLAAQDEDYANKLQEVSDAYIADKDAALADMDADYADKLQQVYEAKDQHDAKKLQQFAAAIDEKHCKLLEEAVAAVSKKHALIMEDVVSKLDSKHADQLQKAVDVIKEKAEKQLKNMQVVYEQKLQQEKDKKVQILAESVQKYLNYALEQKLPKKSLVSEQKYNTAVNTLNKITDYLKVNHIVQESKEEVLSDYEQQLANAKSQINKLIGQKIELTNQSNKKEAQIVLESKLKYSTPAQARYLREYFKNANSPKIIEESIEDAKASFKKIQSEKRRKLQQQARFTNRPSEIVTEAKMSEKVVKPEEPAQKEQVADKKTNKQQNDIAQFYANYLTKK